VKTAKIRSRHALKSKHTPQHSHPKLNGRNSNNAEKVRTVNKT